MPLFRRRGQDKERGSGPPERAARVLDLQDIFDRLEEEIFRADRYERPLVVISFVPQRLGNALDERQVTAAAEFVAGQLRFSDRVGVLPDGTIVAVLPETRQDVARVVANRIATDLTIRSAADAQRNWAAGTSAFPGDGNDPPTLVQSAIDGAQR